MKKFLPLLCALVFALPALAQDTADDKPKEFGFNFNFDYSDKKPHAPAQITFQREVAGGEPVPIQQTVVGKKGVNESEKLSFIDNVGAILGTLDTTFDESGRITGQSLTEGKLPPRALDWFKTGTQSPMLTIGGSAVTASYLVRNGFLSQGIVNLELPSSAPTMTMSYDDMGRREHDEITSSKGLNHFRYLYDQIGMVTMKQTSDASDDVVEIAILRDKDDKVAELNLKNNEVVGYRITPIYDEKGDTIGNKMEGFEKGVLSFVALTRNNSVTAESYKDGVLTSRRTFAKSEGKADVNLSFEEFGADGKLIKRTDFNVDGIAATITTYNEDGTVKSTRKLDPKK